MSQSQSVDRQDGNACVDPCSKIRLQRRLHAFENGIPRDLVHEPIEGPCCPFHGRVCDCLGLEKLTALSTDGIVQITVSVWSEGRQRLIRLWVSFARLGFRGRIHETKLSSSETCRPLPEQRSHCQGKEATARAKKRNAASKTTERSRLAIEWCGMPSKTHGKFAESFIAIVRRHSPSFPACPPGCRPRFRGGPRSAARLRARSGASRGCRGPGTRRAE